MPALTCGSGAQHSSSAGAPEQENVDPRVLRERASRPAAPEGSPGTLREHGSNWGDPSAGGAGQGTHPGFAPCVPQERTSCPAPREVTGPCELWEGGSVSGVPTEGSQGPEGTLQVVSLCMHEHGSHQGTPEAGKKGGDATLDARTCMLEHGSGLSTASEMGRDASLEETLPCSLARGSNLGPHEVARRGRGVAQEADAGVLRERSSNPGTPQDGRKGPARCAGSPAPAALGPGTPANAD